MIKTVRIASAASATLALFLLVACEVGVNAKIPSSAVMHAEGNQRLTYTPDRDGRVYVWDVERGQLIYSGEMRRGDEVAINPSDNRVLINGRTAAETSIPRGDNLRLYFDPGR